MLLTVNSTPTFGYDDPTNPPIKTSSFSFASCSAVFDGNVINLAFIKNNGMATVTVEDENGEVVYEMTVNATSGTSLSIDTTGWENGSYMLVVTNSSGEIYETMIAITQ